MPVVRSSDAASGIVTRALVPLNVSALPYFPAVVHVAFASVPEFPLPDASATVVPDPSLNAYAATKFDCAEATPASNASMVSATAAA